MIKAYKIYTADDGHSHVTTGCLSETFLTQVKTLSFKETPPHSVYDWHPAPVTQYVITLAGTLEFETWTGETFIVRPGEVLIAMDTTGSGHKWKIIDDEPWKRAYIIFDAEAIINFEPDK
jgi:quercetin dioxygenase-like cupin family protein